MLYNKFKHNRQNTTINTYVFIKRHVKIFEDWFWLRPLGNQVKRLASSKRSLYRQVFLRFAFMYALILAFIKKNVHRVFLLLYRKKLINLHIFI